MSTKYSHFHGYAGRTSRQFDWSVLATDHPYATAWEDLCRELWVDIRLETWGDELVFCGAMPRIIEDGEDVTDEISEDVFSDLHGWVDTFGDEWVGSLGWLDAEDIKATAREASFHLVRDGGCL